MNQNQKHSPKYWVCHNKQEEDVYLSTAAKDITSTMKKTSHLFGEGWTEDPSLDIILIELKEVEKL